MPDSMWNSRKTFQNFRNKLQPRSQTIQNFQIVWANTYLVGCGYSYFYDQMRGYSKLYVCNYGPRLRHMIAYVIKVV